MFSKKFKLSLVAATAVVLSLQTLEAREFADIYTECGLGAIIAPNNQAVAAVTNVTWDLGTTAISSNISSEDTCIGGKAKVAAFINDSYENIEKDIAKGEGRYLEKLVALVNNNSVSNEEFISKLRSDLSNTMASIDYSNLSKFEKSEKLYNSIY